MQESKQEGREVTKIVSLVKNGDNTNKCIVLLKAPYSSKIDILLSKNGSALKMPRKPASENVVCLCRLLNILANVSNIFLHTCTQCGP